MEKWAIIRNSSKNKEDLPTKSLIQEIRKLRNDGYQIYDERM